MLENEVQAHVDLNCRVSTLILPFNSLWNGFQQGSFVSNKLKVQVICVGDVFL